ncbi:hypothetical protein, conserved [Eimeria praecox]|uniref:Transmembrane protein n=1 Tax=Eimeria praecox TaxID=51316 RepID=U6G4X1_9EIME|nr:hypothetical protein, conserved [Eimeria praecox]
MSTAAAAGTRRSLLHDVLSHAEVVELGLDGSVDDLPPLTTRLGPPCARAVLLFAWCYFLTFWGAAAVTIRSVISLHADNLLPGAGELVFVAISTVLLVSAEFGVYCHVKAVNPVPSNNGPMGNQFSPTPFCTLAHFMLSAFSRFCSFLELLFLLHAVVLPVPLLACAGFTVSITVGALPFLLQLRCLLGCLFGDRFDPLRLSYCHVKAVNPVPSNNGPMGNQFSPTPFCTLAHFMLSAFSRFCSFLEPVSRLPLSSILCSAADASVSRE